MLLRRAKDVHRTSLTVFIHNHTRQHRIDTLSHLVGTPRHLVNLQVWTASVRAVQRVALRVLVDIQSFDDLLNQLLLVRSRCDQQTVGASIREDLQGVRTSRSLRLRSTAPTVATGAGTDVGHALTHAELRQQHELSLLNRNMLKIIRLEYQLVFHSPQSRIDIALDPAQVGTRVSNDQCAGLSKSSHGAQRPQQLLDLLSHHTHIKLLQRNLNANNLVLADCSSPLVDLQQVVHRHVTNQIRRYRLVDIHTDQEVVLHNQRIPLTLKIPVDNVHRLRNCVLSGIDVSEGARGQLSNVKRIATRRSKILQHLIPGRISHVERKLLSTLPRNCRRTKTGHHHCARGSSTLSLRIVSSRSASSRYHGSPRSRSSTRNSNRCHRLRSSLLRPFRLLLSRQDRLILVIPLLRKRRPLLLSRVESQSRRCLATLSRQGLQLLLLLVRQRQISSHTSIRKRTNTRLTDVDGSQQLQLPAVQQSQSLA